MRILQLPMRALAGPALLLAIPGLALAAPLASPEPAAEPARPIIDTTRQAGEDERIAQRIRGILAELDEFSAVTVEVNEGVVELSGTVAGADTAERAANIAGRVAGVVTVENRLERDLSIEENLSIIGQASDLARDFLAILPLLLVALVVAVAIGVLGYLIAGLGGLWRRFAPNRFLAELIQGAIRFAFVVGGVVVALDMLGAGALMGAVLGGAGVIGIALGFALRDTIENYVASLMLSLRQPFRANDHVLIDELEGRVIRLTSRATILMTMDGNHLRIPNSQVFKAVILNYTRNPRRRFEFDLGVDADDDPRAAMELGREVLAGLPFVLASPDPSAHIQQVGDSNIVIRFMGWVDQRESDWLKSRSLAIAAVKEALEQAGFALPEPIYRLRFDGRTDPLPIGRSAKVVETTPGETRRRAPELDASQEDVKPESEISEMVEQERKSDGEQAKDLLDPSRPVE